MIINMITNTATEKTTLPMTIIIGPEEVIHMLTHTHMDMDMDMFTIITAPDREIRKAC